MVWAIQKQTSRWKNNRDRDLSNSNTDENVQKVPKMVRYKRAMTVQKLSLKS